MHELEWMVLSSSAGSLTINPLLRKLSQFWSLHSEWRMRNPISSKRDLECIVCASRTSKGCLSGAFDSFVLWHTSILTWPTSANSIHWKMIALLCGWNTNVQFVGMIPVEGLSSLYFNYWLPLSWKKKKNNAWNPAMCHWFIANSITLTRASQVISSMSNVSSKRCFGRLLVEMMNRVQSISC